ncbi:MAG: ATP-binding protein [Pseudomonadota bacterium]
MVAESILQRQIRLVDLVEPESFREVIKSFADLYGIGIKVYDAGGTKVADVRLGEASLCSYLFGFAETRQACTRHVSSLKSTGLADVVDGVRVSDCVSGLRYAVVPLSYDGDLLGRLIFGPFWPREAPGPAAALFELQPDLDRGEIDRMADVYRTASDEGVRHMLGQLKSVIDVILYTSYRALLTSSMHVESVTANYHEIIEKNRQLTETTERLKELDRLKSNFLAVVSHELRTPLTSVIGYAEMLLEGMAGELNPEQRDYTSTIMEKGESLLQMISSLLDISRIESGKLKMMWSDVSLGEVAAAAVSTVLPLISKKKIQFIQLLQDNLPTLHCDREKLKQILINLLANAVKFTPVEGQVKLEIDRTLCLRRHPVRVGETEPTSIFDEVEEDFIRFRVTDSGIGIAADHQERVFESFYQVDSSSTREYGGTGLGLSIVKNFVEGHGGDVWVESTPGEGATFQVLLPLVRD